MPDNTMLHTETTHGPCWHLGANYQLPSVEQMETSCLSQRTASEHFVLISIHPVEAPRICKPLHNGHSPKRQTCCKASSQLYLDTPSKQIKQLAIKYTMPDNTMLHTENNAWALLAPWSKLPATISGTNGDFIFVTKDSFRTLRSDIHTSCGSFWPRIFQRAAIGPTDD